MNYHIYYFNQFYLYFVSGTGWISVFKYVIELQNINIPKRYIL
jgi:hypothetical protein